MSRFYGGGGLILSILFLLVKTIEKVNLHGKLKTIFLTYRGVPYTIPLDTPENVLVVKIILKKAEYNQPPHP